MIGSIVAAVPMRILVSGTERQQVLIIQISIMVALLSVGMAILLARDSYRPIRNLANSIGVESAENELNGILTSIENTRMHFYTCAAVIGQECAYYY